MGWLYPTLPKQYGGADLEVEKTVILYDEMARIATLDRGERLVNPAGLAPKWD